MRVLLLLLILPCKSFSSENEDALIELLGYKKAWEHAVTHAVPPLVQADSADDFEFNSLRKEYLIKVERIKLKYLSWEDLEEKLSKKFSSEFTEEEIVEIIEFYSSGAGKKFLDIDGELREKFQAEINSTYNSFKSEFDKVTSEHSSRLREMYGE